MILSSLFLSVGKWTQLGWAIISSKWSAKLMVSGQSVFRHSIYHYISLYMLVLIIVPLISLSVPIPTATLLTTPTLLVTPLIGRPSSANKQHVLAHTHIDGLANEGKWLKFGWSNLNIRGKPYHMVGITCQYFQAQFGTSPCLVLGGCCVILCQNTLTWSCDHLKHNFVCVCMNERTEVTMHD